MVPDLDTSLFTCRRHCVKDHEVIIRISEKLEVRLVSPPIHQCIRLCVKFEYSVVDSIFTSRTCYPTHPPMRQSVRLSICCICTQSDFNPAHFGHTTATMAYSPISSFHIVSQSFHAYLEPTLLFFGESCPEKIPSDCQRRVPANVTFHVSVLTAFRRLLRQSRGRVDKRGH